MHVSRDAVRKKLTSKADSISSCINLFSSQDPSRSSVKFMLFFNSKPTDQWTQILPGFSSTCHLQHMHDCICFCGPPDSWGSLFGQGQERTQMAAGLAVSTQLWVAECCDDWIHRRPLPSWRTFGSYHCWDRKLWGKHNTMPTSIKNQNEQSIWWHFRYDAVTLIVAQVPRE